MFSFPFQYRTTSKILPRSSSQTKEDSDTFIVIFPFLSSLIRGTAKPTTRSFILSLRCGLVFPNLDPITGILDHYPHPLSLSPTSYPSYPWPYQEAALLNRVAHLVE